MHLFYMLKKYYVICNIYLTNSGQAAQVKWHFDNKYENDNKYPKWFTTRL